MAIPYTKTATSLTLVVDFRPTVIPSSHPNFKELSRLAADPKTTEADIKPLLDIPAAVASYTGGDITVIGSQLFYRGVEVKDNLGKIIMGFVKSGDHAASEPFKKFLANVRNNPDHKLIDTIYDWVVNANMPITPDGELIAWKIVGNDYMSKHSGKRGRLRHQIGDVVTEPREECDTDRNRTCSTGIHFASLEYIEKGHYGSKNSGDRIMAVVINPANITSIPTDYNLSKGRCCELRVVGEVQWEKAKDYYRDSGKVYNGWKPVEAEFSPGQRWVARNGKVVTIAASPSGVSSYPVMDTDGNVYTAKGRYNSDTTQSQFDLARRA